MEVKKKQKAIIESILKRPVFPVQTNLGRRGDCTADVKGSAVSFCLTHSASRLRSPCHGHWPVQCEAGASRVQILPQWQLHGGRDRAGGITGHQDRDRKHHFSLCGPEMSAVSILVAESISGRASWACLSEKKPHWKQWALSLLGLTC